MFLGGGRGSAKGKQTSGRPLSCQGDFRLPRRNQTGPRPRAVWRPSRRAAWGDPLREVSLEGSDTQLRPLFGERKAPFLLSRSLPSAARQFSPALPKVLPRGVTTARNVRVHSSLDPSHGKSEESGPQSIPNSHFAPLTHLSLSRIRE